ncbi:MAG: phosphoglycerate dehydrogenase [Gemmatimonadales bacterium]|nr:phosphoglycerate dehydrogenase [Gemmatimonadales bacterium]NIN11111.1 phosphoglycerate dehydrogenase [Gemmatimonadales bacterium]NIN49708.1 phosphoglycerate dehydrogenase [Gemmatimonadales bacterium]NIP07172.1 phosphoglycerate dehydrogenase [Gemmatimonadales bacterium]NIQ99564.1 phosphoglycerate dehydrogenase [Gemmatimonadales bacterium]
MTYVVVVADRIAEPGLALLRAEPELAVITVAGQRDRLRQELERAHALIVRSDTQVTEQLINGAPHLTVVARAGTGVDNVDLEAATRRGIAVLNAPGANTVSAAEHAIALLLALLRRIPWAAASMQRGEWERKRFPGTELRGKRMGLVGLGRVGVRVANVARAFGMRVVAHDPYLPEERAQELGIELQSLDELLRSSDVVSLHTPLTEQTRNLISAERLAQMKPTAVIVNTARGGLVDDVALVEALEAGRIAGAALDVFEPEPLPADSPLRGCDKVLLTPHLAASTSEAQERVAWEICAYVREALLTGSLRGAVNLPGVSSEVMARLSGLLELARRIGRLAAGLARDRVQSVEVSYGGSDDAAPRPTMLAAVEGVLSAMDVEPVSMVNAAVRARQRGMSIGRRVGAPVSGFETTVGVTLGAPDRTVTVEGAMLGERVGRVIRINGFVVDVPADGYVIVLRNRDVPGVIGRVGSLLGEAQINIASYHQSRLERAGTEALAAIVVDQVPSAAVLQELEALSDVLEVRFAVLNGS